jgi:tetratricopeptide (TPR) repeat protein
MHLGPLFYTPNGGPTLIFGNSSFVGEHPGSRLFLKKVLAPLAALLRSSVKLICSMGQTRDSRVTVPPILGLRHAVLTRFIVLLLSGLALLLAFVAFAQSSSPHSTRATDASVPDTPDFSAESRRCALCHPDEVAGYARSAMAHSLRRAASEPAGSVTAHGSRITMRSSPDGYFQRWENGGETSEYRIDYVIGSGTHAAGYLAEIGGHLLQSPVAFYTARQSYDLAPGYENVPDPDFTRPVSEECVLCHSGRALHVAGTLNQYRQPIFAEEAISCDRCHGPLERHLADPRAGNIVNPAKLAPAARDSVCEQCHLFGVARVSNPGKKLSEFLPGQPLEETFTVYHNVLPLASSAGSFKVISHVEQLALSVCARNSGGQLWCGTCHDPHSKPTQPVQFYRSRCLGCHTASFPPSHPSKESDCTSCHMPRRNAQDGGHTVFTDHRIQRRPGQDADLPADLDIAAWREPASDLQKRNLGIAYIDTGMQRHASAFVIRGYRALTAVQHQFPNDSELFKWIGDALLVGRQTADARFAFERALQLDPSPLSEAGAASPYLQSGDTGPAIAHLSRAVSDDPLYLPAASTLIELYRKTGDVTAAADLTAKVKDAMNTMRAPNNSASLSESPNKPAQEVFKNIQVLKGIPGAQLIPTMEFISSSLGVSCDFCHSKGSFEKDDKKTKQTARKMMQMTLWLNQKSFENQHAVTCFSCHRGAADPVSTPPADTESQALATIPQTTSTQPSDAPMLPTVSQLLENYVNALGGAPAISAIHSRVQTGVATVADKASPVEVFTESPNKRAFVRHFPEGDNSTVFDGHSAWLTLSDHRVRDLEGSAADNSRMDADLQLPLHLQQFFSDLRVEYPETIGSRQAHALYAIQDGRPIAKFYFDEQSGLLVRLVRYGPSAFGDNPTQTDYSDYRDVDGVKVPFHLILSEPQATTVVQFNNIEQNVLIKEAVFARPDPKRQP